MTMTNEEAIKWLKTIQASPKVHLIHGGHSEAIDMAIEALTCKKCTDQEKHQLSEETPTNTPTDLISRQAVIDA